MDEPIARVTVAREGGGRVVASVLGDIDLSNAEDVGRELTGAFGSVANVVPVLDLRQVTYIDSQGVRVLHELVSSLARTDVELVIVAPRGSVAGDVMRLTGIDRLVSIIEDPGGSAE